LRIFDIFCVFDNNSFDQDPFDFLAAFKSKHELDYSLHPFKSLASFTAKYSDWIFGYLGYDLKNDIENLSSDNMDNQFFPKMHFFNAEIIIKIKKQLVTIIYNETYLESEIDYLFNKICQIDIINNLSDSIEIKSRISKKEYIKNVCAIKKHLQLGDIYEMNYCQEFYAENVNLDSFSLFSKLNKLSKAPFSCFYRLNNHFCLCASPERYLSKTGNKIISQPIKGTIKKLDNEIADNAQKKKLINSSKDFSENVMIVDLVRNDLSKIAAKNTVKVDELASIYTYKDLHHLISTICCEVSLDTSIADILRATFPMGSMTGAPKIKAMELIEQYENTLRGIYSGAIGYISPKKDFDFNVVIRSILYNQKSNYLSFIVGGAITIDSIPEMEYEECLLKAKSIFKVLGK
jgi:para-aminobenzoate synthetase component 1